MSNEMRRAEGRRLLVVDDEEGPRQSLEMIFSDDFDVSLASSGEEAVRLSRERPFNIVITDIRMRGMTGIDVLRELKQIDKHTEVIVLTAYETLESARQAISFGAADYLRKPFDLDHIQKVVDRCYEHYLFSTNQEAVIRKDVNAAKINFLEIVGHELNTPMNGILGFIDLLEETDLDEEQLESLAHIRSCSLQYFENVQDILTYARLSMSESELSNSSFNPATLVLKVFNGAKPQPGVELASDIPGDLPQYVSGAENEIRIVLNKLFGNALKFTKAGQIRIAVRYEESRPNRGRLHFDVSDTGVGIDPELLQDGRIFDAFSQGDSSMTRAHGGLGLGLSLSEALCGRLGSELRVESEPGKGSTFGFSAPVRREES